MDKYIVTREEIEASQGIERGHFLNENARKTRKSLGDLTGLHGIGFHIIEVQPGRQSTELHAHYHEEECVYILEGEAQATIGEVTSTVRAGDFIGYRAGGEPHKLQNTGDQVLKYIVVGQRLEHDVIDYPRLGKRFFVNEKSKSGLADIDEIEGGT